MANRAALLDILSNEFSSEAQKDQAQAGLAKLDAESIAVTPTEPTAMAPAVEPKGKYFYTTPDRVSLIFSGIELTDDPSGYAEADAKVCASGRCLPQWDGPKYRIAQAEKWNAEWAAKGYGPTFRVVDGDVRMIDKNGEIKSYEQFMLGVRAAAAGTKTVPVAKAVAVDAPKNYVDPLAGHLAQQRENAAKAERAAEKLAAQLILEAQRVSRERLSPSIAQDL